MSSAAGALLKHGVLGRARRGLYAGRMMLSGNQISEDGGNRSRRKWKPNVHNKTLYSEILGRRVPLRVTTHAIRCIDKAGGLDRYILEYTHLELGSEVAAQLRRDMLSAIARAQSRQRAGAQLGVGLAASAAAAEPGAAAALPQEAAAVAASEQMAPANSAG